MGTRSNKRVSKKDKSRRVLNLTAGEPVVIQKPHHRSKKETYSFEPRSDFVDHVPYIDESEAVSLDKLRDDLQEAVERVIRVQHAFVKALNKQASKSNRIKSIEQAIGEIPFHCQLQRKIVSEGVTTILKSKDALAKQRKEEEAEVKRKGHDNNCISCYTCRNF
ncbi:hypothetical protein Poli38472_014828 [Pythium oligandrum]|uniref:Uncharacterized protein n=1 Tax=Pythium oligandrum TaxID=41045 RepID=A0A8K1C7F6_PYTOL|nr:hypothetical protein Poli38472_014828 [Pythium oligandrum]|eukprot:TMW57695.1 hypothetical protein Poli38472_014828 [Pythium oligandrum]